MSKKCSNIYNQYVCIHKYSNLNNHEGVSALYAMLLVILMKQQHEMFDAESYTAESRCILESIIFPTSSIYCL